MASAGRKFKRGKVHTVTPDSARMKKLQQAAQNTPLRHAPFEEDILALLRIIKARLMDVYPLTLAKWEEGFRKDTHPEQQIAFWLAVSERYEQETTGKPLNMAEKNNIFRRLLGRPTISIGNIEHAPVGYVDGRVEPEPPQE